MNSRAFTLIELLVVVAIIAILAVIAVANFREANERALRASDAANLRAIGTALQTYLVDYGKLPPGDREAGPFVSNLGNYTNVGNGPAAGGSWDGVPWVLYERKYIGNWENLFCPKYLKLFRGGKTVRGDQPRFHNFRYAYRIAALTAGGKTSSGDIQIGNKVMKDWLVRDLFLGAESGFYANDKRWNNFQYPWGDKKNTEYVMYGDLSLRLVMGGTDEDPAKDVPNP